MIFYVFSCRDLCSIFHVNIIIYLHYIKENLWTDINEFRGFVCVHLNQ